MADQSEAMGWIGKTVVDRDGGVVGPCTTVLFDDTGAPEWLGVDHAGVRRKLPAGGASTENGRVRVELSRAQVMESPRLTETPPITNHKAGGGRDKQVMGALGALGVLVVAFLTMRWLKQKRQPTQSERFLDSAREAASKAARGGASVLDRTVAVAAPTAVAAGRVATKEGKRAGKVAAKKGRSASEVAAKEGKRAGKVATEQAKRAGGVAAALAATAADEVGDLLESGAEVGHRVGETLGAAPDALAESGKRLKKKWRKLTNRIVMVVALAAGYVFGSAAGRQRYEQIKQAAEKLGSMASSGSR
ncbi:MAG TPA: hypothetical protein VFG72_14990 [Marmoricola sp.]|nr:hypothetical protein [Marmoricola sp.]